MQVLALSLVIPAFSIIKNVTFAMAVQYNKLFTLPTSTAFQLDWFCTALA
jgi:hypothetical protein